MTDQIDNMESIIDFMNEYRSLIIKGFRERWKNWEIEIYDSEMYEVIGGLLSRQVTLSINLASAPQIWNEHVAPLILRAMTDVHITLAWILLKPKERAKEYILYGLGQEKIYIEHLKSEVAEGDEQVKLLIEARESWLNSQRADYLTEVNVGHWAGQDTRRIASEAKCQGLYKFAYSPFSGATHNMWQHISRFNLIRCNNPLHKFHRVAEILEAPSNIDYVYRSVKYVDRSFEAFDKKYKLQIVTPMPHDWFVKNFIKLNNKPIEDNLAVIDPGT